MSKQEGQAAPITREEIEMVLDQIDPNDLGVELTDIFNQLQANRSSAGSNGDLKKGTVSMFLQGLASLGFLKVDRTHKPHRYSRKKPSETSTTQEPEESPMNSEEDESITGTDPMLVASTVQTTSGQLFVFPPTIEGGPGAPDVLSEANSQPMLAERSEARPGREKASSELVRKIYYEIQGKRGFPVDQRKELYELRAMSPRAAEAWKIEAEELLREGIERFEEVRRQTAENCARIVMVHLHRNVQALFGERFDLQGPDYLAELLQKIAEAAKLGVLTHGPLNRISDLEQEVHALGASIETQNVELDRRIKKVEERVSGFERDIQEWGFHPEFIDTLINALMKRAAEKSASREDLDASKVPPTSSVVPPASAAEDAFADDTPMPMWQIVVGMVAVAAVAWFLLF